MNTETLVVKEVGEEPDHVEQGERDARPECSDGYRQGHQAQDGRCRGEVAQRSLCGVAPSPIVRPEMCHQKVELTSVVGGDSSLQVRSRPWPPRYLCTGSGGGFGHSRRRSNLCYGSCRSRRRVHRVEAITS